MNKNRHLVVNSFGEPNGNGTEHDDMILGENSVSNFNSEETGLNNNSIIFGSTGTGKTFSYTIPQILNTYNNNLVITCTKRKVVDDVEVLLRSRGYDVNIIDLTGMGQSTVRFDPFDYMIDETDIISFAKTVIQASKEGTDSRDPFWDNSAVSLVCAEAAALLEQHKHFEEGTMKTAMTPCIESLVNLHAGLKFIETDRSGFTTSTLDTVFARLDQADSKSFAYRSFKTVEGLTSKTVSCIKSTVDTAFSNTFTPGVLGAAVRRNAFNIQDFANRKSVLFLITSPWKIAQRFM